MLAAPFLVWLIVEARFGTALLVVGFAGISDWLDGYTARRLGATGNLGTILDPLADKAMLVSLFLALTYVALIPIWVLALVLGRDAVIVTGAVLLRIFRGIQKFVPSTVGKVSTFFQIVFVLLVLLYAAFPWILLFWLKITALVLVVLFTAWSGMSYIRLGIRLTRRLPA